MCDYNMLADGDRVLVAVSGGIDSLVLIRTLQLWQKKAPVSYVLHGVHIDMGAGGNGESEVACKVAAAVKKMSIPCDVVPAAWKPLPQMQGNGDDKDTCFRCARSRRTQLFALADRHGCNKLALGHHLDDLVETFFLNMIHAGNLSTMLPKQELFSGQLALIRPLAYLEKMEVHTIGEDLGLQPIRSFCPLSERTSRQEIQQILEMITAKIPDAKKHIFAAMGNCRPEYLLKSRMKNGYADQS